MIKVVRSCEVSFDVWKQPNTDGKAGGKHDWTSLLGADKKIVFDALPDKMMSFLRRETSDTIVKLWKHFNQSYKIVNNWPPEHNPEDFYHSSQGMDQLFLAIKW